jgi:hypothetical protein
MKALHIYILYTPQIFVISFFIYLLSHMESTYLMSQSQISQKIFKNAWISYEIDEKKHQIHVFWCIM